MSGPAPAFGGRVPETYDRLMGPIFFQPYAAETARRLAWLRRGELLETAAGTGILTVALAATLPPEVATIATDLAPPMLAEAASKLPRGRVTLQPADAQALPFEDRRFDAVVSQFGMMFPPDKAAAFAEARRVLKPGGRFLFSVWGALARNPPVALVQEVVAACFPADPPLFMARIPHGYHDTAAITAALAAAGFTEIEAEPLALPCRAASARHLAAAICQGTPLRAEIEARGEPGLDRVTAAAAQAVADRMADGDADAPIASTMEAILVSAVRPA